MEEFLKNIHDFMVDNVTKMKGIYPKIIVHRLNIKREAKLVKQKKRSFTPKSQEIIKEEIHKLIDIGFISKVM